MYFDVWWELQNAENPKHSQYFETAAKYRLFFEATTGAQLVAILVLLYQAFENRKDTQNFRTLISRLDKEEPGAQELVARLRDDMDQLMPVWQKVARARSNAIAHLSHTASSEDLMAAADLSPNEIGKLIAASKKLLAALSEYFGILGTAMLNPNAAAHARQLMDDLAKGTEKR